MPSGARFVFDRFELDPGRRSLTVNGEPVAIADRQLDVLLMLVARAGQIVSKDELLQAAWKDVAVGDNSLEQAISGLRKVLSAHPPAAPYIDTVARRGYRFRAPVTRAAPRESDAALDALLAPHRAFIEGRAALETLERDQIVRARDVFERAVRSVPELASAHIGLANACVLQFEMTRADAAPDSRALAMAATHAREACRLDPQSGEAWATLGFVLDRTGDRVDAIAASKRAITLEPDNWRHHLRLAYVGWGEERLRAAHRTLTFLPEFPLARWLAATVHVARQAFEEAEREVTAAVASGGRRAAADARFSPIALHWLLGLLHLRAGDDARALSAFERELANVSGGHLYARECRANTYYAIGALHWRSARGQEAAAAFTCALEHVSNHPLARAGLCACGVAAPPPLENLEEQPLSVDAAIGAAAFLVAARADHAHAARLVRTALAHAPAGSAGWLLPLEPLLNVGAQPSHWADALNAVRNRAV